jgi:tetratricopeptide (TPR) repeat protein
MKHKQTPFWLCLPLSVLMTSGPFLAAWAQPDYYTLKAHGKSIGQVRIDHYPASVTAGGQNAGTVTEIQNTNHFTREGEPFALNEVSRFVENAQNGHPLSFSYNYDLGQQHLMEAQGQLQGNALDLRLLREDTLAQGTTPIAAERFLFPDGEAMHQVYRQHFQDPVGSRFAFQTLALGMQPQIVNSEVTPGKREHLRLAHGKRQMVRKFEIKNPANPKVGINEWRDAQGRLYKAQSTGDDEMELVLAAVGDERRLDNLDVVRASAVVSNKIAQPRITTEGLYRLAPIHGQTLNWAATVPQGDRQTFDKQSDNQLYLKVTQQEPQDSSINFPLDGPPEYLHSTPYLQSNDPEIDRIALDVAGQEKRAYYAARMLQQWVYQNVAQKDLSLGFASAKETLLRRQGDCTEHAVLLTAMNRALGIPARVAVGLIYVPNGDSQLGRFVYHMWTEIYLGDRSQGEWVPLDATNPESLVDATHIKLADSPLNSASDLVNLTQRVTDVMGRIKIDVLKAVSISQSVLNMDQSAGITATALHSVDIKAIDVQRLSKQAIQHFRVELPPPAMSKESPDRLFTYGVEALSKGHYAEAQDNFRQAITQLRRPLALYRLGERLAGVEMYALAQEAFQRAADKDPSLAPLTQAWASAYLPSRNLSSELNQQWMQALHASSPATSTVLLKTVTAQAPYFAPAYRHLGEALSGEEAISALQQAVSLAPNDFRNQESLADAYMAQGRYETAWQIYMGAAQTLKTHPAFLQSKPEWLRDLEGKQAWAHGANLLAHHKQDATGWLTLSKGLFQQNQREEAMQAVSNALSLSPGNPEAQVMRFRMALQKSDWKTIFAYKDSLAALANQHAPAANLLGLYQMRSRQYGPAVHSLQRAIGLSPTEGEAYRTLSQTYLRMAELAQQQQSGGKGLTRSKQLQAQAQQALRRGMARASQATEGHSLALQLGKLLLKSGQAVEAQRLAENVLACNPINGEAWTVKGKAQLFQGDNSGAQATLEIALALNPNDPDTLVLLGHVAKEAERDALAMDFYQKAYKADSYHQEAADAVRSMMTQLHIAGYTPPQYWFLSDDEHDYVVQLLYQGRRLKRHTLTYLQTLNTLPGRAGRIEYSSKGIASAQQLQAALEKMKQNESILYGNLQNTIVPNRFSLVHTELQSAVLDEMNMLTLGLQQGPILVHSARETSTFEYAFLLAGITRTQLSMNHLLEQLNAHLPAPVFAGLLSEAQLDDLGAINQEIDHITNTLISKNEPPKSSSTSTSVLGQSPSNLARPILKGP